MPRKFTTKLLAVAIALSPISLVATTLPASAQGNFRVSFGYFYDELAPYGQWFHHPRWGDVWHPRRVSRDFRPYNRGHWDYTNRYGWVWAADYEWGDIPFHYGRWVYDPYDGWLWVPGYVWSPAWVVWRSGGGYVSWFPMPPDEAFLAGDEVYRTNWDNWDRGFGYTDWYGPRFGPSWLMSIGTFVDERHFADRDFIRYAPPPNQLVNIVNNTRNVTNYATVNNYIVNRSVDPAQIQRASGRQIVVVPEQQVIRANVPIVPVNLGREVQQQERRQHGGDPRASAQARVVALTPEAAHANAPPKDVGNNRPDDNQPGGRFNRNNREANQPGAPNVNPNLANNPREQQGGPNPDQRRGLRPNEAAPPPAGPTATENRHDRRGAAEAQRAERERAAAEAQRAERERAATQAQGNRDRAAAEAQRADRERAAAQAQGNRDRASAEAQRADRERAAAEAQAQASRGRDRAAAQAQAANRERAQAQGRPPRAQPEAPPPARSEAAPATQPQEVNNQRNQRQRRDQKDQKKTN